MEGLPVSISLVGRAGSDRMLLNVAARLHGALQETWGALRATVREEKAQEARRAREAQEARAR